MRIVIWLSVKLQSASILFFNSVEAIHLWHLNSTWLLSSGCPFKELHIEAVPIAFPNNFISCHCWGDEVGKEQKVSKLCLMFILVTVRSCCWPNSRTHKKIFCGLLTVYLHPMCRFNNFQGLSLDKYAGMTKVVFFEGLVAPKRCRSNNPSHNWRGWEQPVGWEPGKSSQKWAKSCIQSYYLWIVGPKICSTDIVWGSLGRTCSKKNCLVIC